LGEHLVQLGKLTEDELYEALSPPAKSPRGTNRTTGDQQHHCPGLAPPPDPRLAGSSFPSRIGKTCSLPAPKIPSEQLTRTLSGYTGLALRFHLVTPQNFDELTHEFL